MNSLKALIYSDELACHSMNFATKLAMCSIYDGMPSSPFVGSAFALICTCLLLSVVLKLEHVAAVEGDKHSASPIDLKLERLVSQSHSNVSQ